MSAPGAPGASGSAAARRRREPVWWLSVRVLDAAVRAMVDVRVVGLERIPASGPALLAANHVSHLDPVVLLTVAHRAGRKLRVLAVQEAFDKPVTGWFLRAGRHIPVGSGPSGLSAVRLAREALADGELVLVYPEGTIPGDAQVAAAKAGAGLLALSSGVPVLPVATRGLERGTRWWRRRRAVAVVGAPVDLQGVEHERGRQRYDEASTLILRSVRALLPAAGA